MKCGAPYLYLTAWRPEGPVKVGSSVNPKKRISVIRCMDRVPALTIHATWHCGAYAGLVEHLTYDMLNPAALSGEWYALPVRRAVDYLEGLLATLPLAAMQRLYETRAEGRTPERVRQMSIVQGSIRLARERFAPIAAPNEPRQLLQEYVTPGFTERLRESLERANLATNPKMDSRA